MRLYLNKNEVPTIEKALRISKQYFPCTLTEKTIIENVLSRMEQLKYVPDTKITITIEEV